MGGGGGAEDKEVVFWAYNTAGERCSGVKSLFASQPPLALNVCRWSIQAGWWGYSQSCMMSNFLLDQQTIESNTYPRKSA